MGQAGDDAREPDIRSQDTCIRQYYMFRSPVTNGFYISLRLELAQHIKFTTMDNNFELHTIHVKVIYSPSHYNEPEFDTNLMPH